MPVYSMSWINLHNNFCDWNDDWDFMVTHLYLDAALLDPKPNDPFGADDVERKLTAKES